MIQGKYRLGFMVFAIVLLWSAVYAGSAFAEIDLGGRLDMNFVTQISHEGDVQFNWLQHLNLGLILPTEQNLSGRVEFDLYSQWKTPLMSSPFTVQLSKLYLKQRFDQFHLTVGRQPITWSFGSLLNPLDYSVAQVTGYALDLDGAAKNYDGVIGYIPLGQVSDLTIAVSFPAQANNPKMAARARTQVGRFEIGFNCIRDVEVVQNLDGEGQPLPPVDHASLRLGATAKGDLGPVGVYGAAGYVPNQNDSVGQFFGMIGFDTSIPVVGDSKVVAQMEYMYDQTGLMQGAEYGAHLLAGTLSYEIDEFAGVSVAGLVNPTDHSFIFAPMYQNQIGDGLELTVTGAYFGGGADTQFGPRIWLPDGSILIPRSMVQLGLGYTF